jgi:hypothetical protein
MARPKSPLTKEKTAVVRQATGPGFIPVATLVLLWSIYRRFVYGSWPPLIKPRSDGKGGPRDRWCCG